uniref:Uncharacterized protein n=1 Tax=Vespula pensylvanica TaxID=30213 RepID=A0A834UEK8_VESPE|nr:hypothetical protein H0235_003320 [Vespula pensylvanica]
MTMTDAESHDESRCALRINIALFASLMPPCRADDHLGGFRKCIDEDDDDDDDEDDDEDDDDNDGDEEEEEKEKKMKMKTKKRTSSYD